MRLEMCLCTILKEHFMSSRCTGDPSPSRNQTNDSLHCPCLLIPWKIDPFVSIHVWFVVYLYNWVSVEPVKDACQWCSTRITPAYVIVLVWYPSQFFSRSTIITHLQIYITLVMLLLDLKVWDALYITGSHHLYPPPSIVLRGYN